jgi:hypothetical protein
MWTLPKCNQHRTLAKLPTDYVLAASTFIARQPAFVFVFVLICFFTLEQVAI